MFEPSIVLCSPIIHLSLKASIYHFYPLIPSGLWGSLVFMSTSHCPRGGVHPGQLASPSQDSSKGLCCEIILPNHMTPCWRHPINTFLNLLSFLLVLTHRCWRFSTVFSNPLFALRNRSGNIPKTEAKSAHLALCWHQRVMKSQENSGIKSFSRQEETITFQVPLARWVTRLIRCFQKEIDAGSFRSQSSGSGELPWDHYGALKQEGSQLVGS